MKRILMAIAFTCALSVVASAGEVPSVGLTEEQGDKTNTLSNAPMPGDIPSDGYTEGLRPSTINLAQLIIGLMV